MRYDNVVDKENCFSCQKPIEGKWDSQVHLGLETGELDKNGIYKHFIYDKHIKCSPSRAQRIIHPAYPQVFDDRESFDMRLWTEEKRDKFVKMYTYAWVRLQEKYNPNW